MTVNYDRIAVFLLLRTTPGFCKGLRYSPVAALNNAGFHPGESLQLAASLGKIRNSHPRLWQDTTERTTTDFTYQQIEYEDIEWKKADTNSWKA